jgi:serine transporter
MKSNWNKNDRAWMLGLYGTAIGAGTLFLPINVGINGIISLLILTALAFPMTYLSHRALCRMVLSGSSHQANITAVIDEHFGHIASRFLTFLYFISIYPIVLLYSVALTNTALSFIQHQTAFTPPPRILISFVLVFILVGIARIGHHAIIKAMNVLVYPFVISLITLALYLTPHWNTAIFTTGAGINTHQTFMMSLWMGIPVIVFSFSHVPMISPFAVKQRHSYGKNADKKCSQILSYSHLMMMITVFFFVFSCVLSLSPEELAQAKSQNISILSYLANHFSSPFITYVAPLIAFIAISKSYLGHYIGANEGLHGIVVKELRHHKIPFSDKILYLCVDIFLLVSCWIVATLNPNILGMIETLSGPIIAAILFLLPMYAMRKIANMKIYRALGRDLFITIIGFIAISAMLYGLWQL